MGYGAGRYLWLCMGFHLFLLYQKELGGLKIAWYVFLRFQMEMFVRKVLYSLYSRQEGNCCGKSILLSY